jgi:hypothetical protein
MVDFRRWITALAVLALFAGLAGAQVGGSNVVQLSCATNVSSTPQLRAEGYTEQTGDITITCTGGPQLTAGSLIPTVNITIFLNTAVTSRLLPQSGVSNNISEALLMIDEPGSSVNTIVPGFGPGANQRVCGVSGTFFGPNSTTSVGANSGIQATPLTGCTEYATNLNGVTVATDTYQGTGVVGSATPGANVFQGIVNANSVTFFGVPSLPPVSTGTSRVFRITNVRANATALGGGSASGATPVVASIAVSNSAALPITNPTPTVGFVQSGLSTSASSASNKQQCVGQTKQSINTLTFTELFGTAFKTRVLAQNNTTFAGQGVPPAAAPGNQNTPGSIYNSESNFVLPVPGGGTAGLADFGTRLKATFNNVPTGARIFVSVANVVNNAVGITAPAVIGGSAANLTTTSYALLVQSETVADGNQVTNSGGFFPSVTATDNGPNNGNVPIAEIPVVNGSATAIWEVVNTSPSSLDSLKFAVYTTFTANVAQNSPPAGTATVNLSFAPTPPSFTASSGAAASSSLTIPRFIADPNAAKNILNINVCRSILLYPFVTNQSGFDTGLAIANTSTDPFGTGAQAGTCTLNWYSGATNPAPTTTASIPSGTVYTTLASTTVSGFQGYMIAVCQFQYAHGFAFISDLGARQLAMGYLALVIPDPASQNNSIRNASSSGCGTGDINCGGGEGDAH